LPIAQLLLKKVPLRQIGQPAVPCPAPRSAILLIATSSINALHGCVLPHCVSREAKTAVRLHLVMLSAVMSIVAGDAAAQTVSSGTAFSVASEVLITNRHVVKGCSSVDVMSSDGRRTASIAASDAVIDLAILRVSGLRGTTARLRDPTDVLLGESVLVFGYPLTGKLSSGGNFTSGLVSALRGLRDSANHIQITSPDTGGQQRRSIDGLLWSGDWCYSKQARSFKRSQVNRRYSSECEFCNFIESPHTIPRQAQNRFPDHGTISSTGHGARGGDGAKFHASD